MTSFFEGRLAKALGFAVAVLIPLGGLLLASRRQIEAGVAFLLHESLGMGGPLLLVVLAPAVATGCLYWLRRKPATRLGFASKTILARFRVVLIGLTVVSLVVSAIHLRTRYRIFSEVSFQEEVIAAVEDGDLRRALRVCHRYLALYPHRAAGGSIQDPVCTPVVAFASDMGTLLEYVAAQSPAPWRGDELVILPEEAAGPRAGRILREWAGR